MFVVLYDRISSLNIVLKLLRDLLVLHDEKFLGTWNLLVVCVCVYVCVCVCVKLLSQWMWLHLVHVLCFHEQKISNSRYGCRCFHVSCLLHQLILLLAPYVWYVRSLCFPCCPPTASKAATLKELMWYILSSVVPHFLAMKVPPHRYKYNLLDPVLWISSEG